MICSSVHCFLSCVSTRAPRKLVLFWSDPTQVKQFVFACLLKHSLLLLGHARGNLGSDGKKNQKQIVVACPVFTCFCSIRPNYKSRLHNMSSVVVFYLTPPRELCQPAVFCAVQQLPRRLSSQRIKGRGQETLWFGCSFT